MSLRCLSYVHDERGHHREHRFEDAFDGLRVLVFDPRIERGDRTIGDRWRQLDASMRAVELVIIRGSVEAFAEQVASDDLLPDLLRDIPVLALAGSWARHEPQPALTRPSWSLPPPLTPALEELRHYELLTLLLESKAVTREEGCHFLLPSSSVHADAFIRLADALDDHTDLVRLCDWLLPYLADDCGVVGDNGSLLALLATLGHEAQRRFGWPHIPIATLRDYPSGVHAVRAFLDAFRTQDWGRLLFLVTVSSSGRVARLFAEAAEEPSRVVVLCATDEDDTDTECVTRCVVRRWSMRDDGVCDECENRHVLEIDPRTYEIRAALRRVPQKIDVPSGMRCKPFWEAADRRSAVSLHVWVPTASNPGAPRHLAVALDVVALLADDWFRGGCIGLLRKQPRPDLVLIPGHEAAQPLTALICEAHDLDVQTIAEVSPGAFPAELVERVRGAGTVLIADDVLITAETLVGLRHGVYAAGQPDLDIPTWGFVGVMRPPTSLERDYARRTFTAPSGRPENPYEQRLACGFELMLPAPGTANCPWCAERDLLAERLADLSGEAADIAGERLARLRAPGLEPPLLITGGDDKMSTRGSFLGELRSKAAFAAASSVAQGMKDSFARDRGPQELRILDVPYTLQSFWDPILRAGLLRTFDRRELRDHAHDVQTEQTLAKVGLPGALTEAALAAVVGKLPCEAIVRRLEAGDDPSVAALMLALLGREA